MIYNSYKLPLKMLEIPKMAQNDLTQLIEKYSITDSVYQTEIPSLRLIKMLSANIKMPTIYNPSLCIIAQGEKSVSLGAEAFSYGPSQYLVVSVDLPIIGQITKTSIEKPYLSLQIDIDPHQIGDLVSQATLKPSANTCRGLFVGNTDNAMADSVLRLVKLLETPADIPVLAPLALREIYYRLLNSPYGNEIAQLTLNGSNIQRISSVIQLLKENFTKQIRIEDMAATAKMSLSSFHNHFKSITAMSPLQYQKRLRLTEARRIMLVNDTDAASAAYSVGYESTSQFSREYARMFGAPPMKDINTIKGKPLEQMALAE
ncbi:AraC family transcriptional regulator [Kordiimonas pumila]|uniref:AraC family transcriptional regulator n=1 Tax=Kordiimonas pumila TaxID=2161677 RepID=A0ABV7D983_9PROT|nr:AraC family transcriptional regulator [Kordiimonas pumila]